MKPPFEVIVPAVEAACASGPPEVLRAALGAVASRFLAVGTPRSIGLIGPAALADLALAAHRVYFAPRDVRRDAVIEACACDIVCVADPAVTIEAAWIRRGTHLDVWAGTLDPALLALARVETAASFHEVAAGFRDGRELDEITIFRHP